jgi:ribosomal protein S18 acetylase RimI-like enzyme
MSVVIRSLAAPDVAPHRPALVALLRDAVDSGASVGFLPPLGEAEATAYWETVVPALREGSRVLLVAQDPVLGLAGAGQLELAARPNASHRAEVAKVMVHRGARRRGIGRALMLALEAEAYRRGRTTLILDTRQGDPSEALYRGVGWTLAGTIPRYARSADGSLDATAIYYKLLDGA